MRKYVRWVFLGSVIGLFASAGAVMAQEVTPVARILSNPGTFINQEVTVVGEVVRFVDTQRNSSPYVLEDDFAQEIEVVSTGGRPEVGSRWMVKGLVAVSPLGGTYIVEGSRVAQAGQSTQGNAAPLGQAVTPAAPASGSGLNGSGDATGGASSLNLLLMNRQFLLIGAGVFLLAVAAFLILRRGQQPAAQTAGGDFAAPYRTQAPVAAPDPNPTISLPTSDEDFFSGKTVRFAVPSSSDGTLRLLPGRLEIVGGPDKGNEIRFVHPGGAVPEITFGRSSGPKFAHIQLTAPTVSRKHALMKFQDSFWSIANFSETNPVRVNQQALSAVGEAQKLNDGDILEFGEVSMAFRAQ